MDELLKSLKNVGVHNINNDYEIILEILEDKVNNINEVDTAINELIINLKCNKQKKIMLECPKYLLDNLKITKEKMKIVGERVIFTKEFKEPIKNLIPDYEVWSIDNSNSNLFYQR